MERMFIAHSSSDETLYFKSLNGIERLSEAYKFEVELLSEKRLSDPISLHNTVLTVEIKTPSKQKRYLSGYIEQISYDPFYKYDDRLYLYTATVRPKLWELKKKLGYSIWQEKTVPEIIATVLVDAGIFFEDRLLEKYRTWEYCVKYNETDFDFIHRLMAHEGIYYYFKHDMGSHTMVLVDMPQMLGPMPGYNTINYFNVGKSSKKPGKEYIYNWNIRSTTIPNNFSLDDYDFRKPRAKLQAAIQTSLSSVNNTEIFMWPGRYVKSGQGQFYARVLQQAAEAQSELINGKGNVLGMAPGHTFTLSLPNDIKGDDYNDYLITGAQYAFEACYGFALNCEYDDDDDCDGDKPNKDKNVVQFDAIPANVHWKPPAVTPWPKATGLETAVVTGPKDKPIWTDKYGRIKVKFRWDKSDKKDDTSSCWIRVATRWAGWRYGSIYVPRVGEEVVISFVNGDPDKPFVIGSAYNNENMPPWELPKYETRSGVMSNTKEGKHEQANYLFMDDTPDKELFNLHAERDMNISVEKDKNVTIDGNRTTEIKKQQTDTVTDKASFTYKDARDTTVKGKDTLTIENSQQRTIEKGRKTEISDGDTYKLKGDLSAKIDGNWTQNITGTTLISSPNLITIKSDTHVAIDCPQSFYTSKIFSVSSVKISISSVKLSLSHTNLSISSTNTSLSSTMLSISSTGTSLSKTGTDISQSNTKLAKAITSIVQTSANILNSSLHIIS
ncbi:type VI secretion system secreted protein VgrG [Xenorhabdus cabanillasii]|uniref:Type VI secretion system secreted protein VgrG n=2 Tax=Xenorhabdus cabanillasii TaxID=351673 RepID=A0A3D9UFB0_9GAMM|nr:type VI secretion system secreted protein VgrG [Xenorhabdus cabanillasii]